MLNTQLVITYLMEYVEDWSASRVYLSKQSVQTILRQQLPSRFTLLFENYT